MFARRCVQGSLLLCLSAVVFGCGSSGLDSIQVTPPTQSLTVGQTAQFSAVGTYGNAKHATTNNITSAVNWTSSAPSVATVSAAGVATAVSPGTTTITAGGRAFNGATSASATLTVTGTSGGSAGNLLSVNIIPSSITVGNLQDTGNFLAFGTFSSAPFVRDLTNSVTWVSSSPDVFPVNTNSSVAEPVGSTAGVVTAYGTGGATITAEATGSNGSIETATATFNCPLVLPTPTTAGSCYPGSQAPALKATITIFNEGLNTTDWEITAPSATGTPDVIHCGPGWAASGGTGGSVCSAAYPIGTTVTITAPATGAAFGGWSYNCAPTAPLTAAGPNSCTVTLSGGNPNVALGAIFN
jgi:Bacterial Ig-like domain (group 2)